MPNIQAMTCGDDLTKIKERMAHDGGILLDLDGPGSFEELDNLNAFLQQRHSDPCTITAANRDDSQNETGRRFSLNPFKYQNEPCWQKACSCVLNQITHILEGLLETKFNIYSTGGDVVLRHTTARQAIHGDGYRQRPLDNGKFDQHPTWSPYLVISIAVHDIDELQAPLLFVGRQTMMQHERAEPPDYQTEPSHWHQRVLPMKRGQVFVRDPRVWHAGTPNCTDKDRFLPGFVVSSCDY